MNTTLATNSTTTLIYDAVSSASAKSLFSSFTKQALTLITFNGLLFSGVKAAVTTCGDPVRCAAICAHHLPDLSRYAACVARCLALGS